LGLEGPRFRKVALKDFSRVEVLTTRQPWAQSRLVLGTDRLFRLPFYGPSGERFEAYQLQESCEALLPVAYALGALGETPVVITSFSEEHGRDVSDSVGVPGPEHLGAPLSRQ
jgi:hypothetical protein